MLILLALAFVTNVSYVAAFRQCSILLGVAFGVLVLKKPAFAPKVAGGPSSSWALCWWR